MLSDTQRKSLRQMDDEATLNIAEATRVGPRTGYINLGGAHIDYLARGLGLQTFVFEIYKSNSSDSALTEAKKASADVIKQWNIRSVRDHVVRRWEGGADNYLQIKKQLYDNCDKQMNTPHDRQFPIFSIHAAPADDERTSSSIYYHIVDKLDDATYHRLITLRKTTDEHNGSTSWSISDEEVLLSDFPELHEDVGNDMMRDELKQLLMFLRDVNNKYFK